MKHLQYIRTRNADPDGATLGRVSPATFRITNEGLSLLGFMWKVDHFVKFPSLKDKYGESWSRLWHSNTTLRLKSPDATPKTYSTHEMSKAHWLAITQIIFEVIELLREGNQISIADAIWHSVTDADWRKGRSLESVAEFPEQLTVEKRKGMFQLEKRTDGSFAHKWLIDRIISQGGFWVGRLVRLSTDHDYSDKITTRGGESDTASCDNQAGCAPDNANKVSEQSGPKTHSDYQSALAMLMKMTEYTMMMDESTESDQPIDPYEAIGNSPEATAELVAALSNINSRNSQAFLRKQRAIFDIEGDISGQVLVLTPFQQRLESLPRPITRSMSVSWAVQSVSHINESEDNGDWNQETLKTTGMVRGMWKFMVQPPNRYNLV